MSNSPKSKSNGALHDEDMGNSGDETPSDHGPTPTDDVDTVGRAPRRVSLRKGTPRVIGIKKESKKKGPRFAKKADDDSPTPQPHELNFNANGDQSSFAFMNEEVPPPQAEEMSAFGFINDTPVEIIPTPEPESKPAPTESAFAFIEQPIQPVESAFDFIEPSPPPVVPEETLPSDFGNFIDPDILLSQYHKVIESEAAQKAYESAPGCDRSSDEYDNILYEAYSARQDFVSSLQQCMMLIQMLPQSLSTHITSEFAKIPQKEEQISTLQQQLNDINDRQITESADLDLKRALNSTQIQAVTKPVAKLKTKLEHKIIDLDKRIEDAVHDNKENISDLEIERDIENERIQELLAEVERHRQLVRNIDQKIKDEEKKRQAIISTFDGDKRQIATEQSLIDSEEATANARIREIEAPYQSLIDSVEVRAKQINDMTAQVDQLTEEIADLKNAMDNTDEVNALLAQINQSFQDYNQQRNDMIDAQAEASSSLRDGEKQIAHLSEQSYHMAIEVERGRSDMLEMEARIHMLEDQKKDAVAARNFMEAKKVTTDLKELMEQMDAINTTQADKRAQSDLLEQQLEKMTADTSSAEIKTRDIETKLVELDYDYYLNTNRHLDELFELSSSAKQKLSGIASVFKEALKTAVKPVGMSRDELNQRLEKAIAEEDFELAGRLQAQIDTADL